MTPQRLLQVADKTRTVVLPNLRVICRCLVCNQDLQVMVHELFSGHCYSMPSLTIVCNHKWAVSSIKPPLPLLTVSGGSAEHEKSPLYSVLERVLLLALENSYFPHHSPWQCIAHSAFDFCKYLPSDIMRPPGAERWKGFWVMPFPFLMSSCLSAMWKI